MKLKLIKGNLLSLAKEGYFDIIIHGANCKNIMEAGIALNIAKEFPTAVDADSNTKKGDYKKLSDYSCAYINTREISTPRKTELFIVNLYTQYNPGKDFMLSALDLGLYKLINEFAGIKEMRIGIPWIGCGIGGGDKKEVKKVLEKYGKLINLTLVEL